LNALYILNTKDLKAVESDFISMVTQDELTYLDKVTSEKRRLEYLSSRAILRLLIKEIFDFQIGFEITYSSNGKPFLDSKVHFNYSHSGSYILFGLSNMVPIGVDIETKNAEKSFLKLAKKYFSEVENIYILNTDNLEEQKNRFQHLWSLKEAYFKSADLKINSLNTKNYFDLEKNCISSLPSEVPVQIGYGAWLGHSIIRS
jgi:4'-phosphopantetheinyl transferase